MTADLNAAFIIVLALLVLHHSGVLDLCAVTLRTTPANSATAATTSQTGDTVKPGASNASIRLAVAASAVNEATSHPNFHVFGGGRVSSQDWRRDQSRVTTPTSTYPVLVTLAGGSSADLEPEIMITVNALSTSTTDAIVSIHVPRHLDGPTLDSALKRAGFAHTAGGFQMLARIGGAVLADLDHTSDQTATRISVRLRSYGEPGMGSRLVADLEHLADHLDATICDGGTAPLNLPELNAIAAGIDGLAAQRTSNPPALSAEPPAPPAPVRQLDGTVPGPGLLSFTHKLLTAKGKSLGVCYFDPTPMSHFEGQREGMRRAGELLAHIKLHGSTLQTREILKAALVIDQQPAARFPGKSASNASGGFLSVVVAMLHGAAQHLDCAAFVERGIADSLASEQGLANWDRDRRRGIGIKAAATRKARREAKVAP